MTLNTASHSLQFVKVNNLVGPDSCVFGDVTGVDSPVTAPSRFFSFYVLGDTRAVVASRRSGDSPIRALQLTVDHVIGSNQDEALRLSQLGLDIGSAFCSLGNHGYTR